MSAVPGAAPEVADRMVAAIGGNAGAKRSGARNTLRVLLLGALLVGAGGVGPATAASATATAAAAADDTVRNGTADLRAFGARGDGRTDDTAAFDAAASALLREPNGGRLHVPAGRYRFGRAPHPIVLRAGQSLAIDGDGIGASTLVIAGDGLRVVLNAADATLAVRALSLLHDGPVRGGTGLTVTRAVTAASGGTDAFDHLLVGGVERSVAWQDGVRLTGLSSPVISAVTVVLPDDISGSATAGGTGLAISGVSSDHYATDSKISDCTFQGGSAGIRVGPFVQGVFWANSEALGGDYGVLWEDRGGGGSLPELLLMSGGHVAAHVAGVRTRGVNENIVEGLLFLHFAPSRSGDWHAVDEANTEDDTVTGNVVQGTGVGRETAFRFARGQLVAISGNEVTYLSGPAVALDGVRNASVIGNTFAGVDVAAPITGGGGNAVGPNLVDGRAAGGGAR